MNAIQEETVSVLNGLVSTCRDGQEGFRTASECVAEDPELKMLLSSFSLQRSKFAGELETELINMGEHHPETEGPSASGAAHRGWISLKAAMTRADNHAILAECERGEDAAVAEYNKALTHEIPDPVREIVQRQRQEVVATHNTIRALRDATPAAAARVMSTARKSVKGAVQGVQQKSERAAASAAEVWDDMKSRAEDLRKSSEVYVRRNPLPSLAGALLAGFTIGMIFYALELRNERTRLQIETRPLRRIGTALAGWTGFVLGRARSGYTASVGTVQDRVGELSGTTSGKFLRRQRNRVSKGIQNLWRRVA
jgi:uncharacterized protein (TIGR02284 family)